MFNDFMTILKQISAFFDILLIAINFIS